MCSSNSQIIICFECKQQIKKKQLFSLCNSCNQNYHSQCFNKHSNTKNSLNKSLCLNCSATLFPFHALESSDFSNLFTTDLNQQKHSYDAKKLNQLFPEICTEVSNDTETQICSLGNDSYLSSNEAAILLKNSSENTFSSICINMRSLINPNNFTKFECLISALDFSPHITAVNETWEKPNSTGQYKNLKNYIYLSNPRKNNKGGGVALYIKKNLIFDIRSDLNIMDEKIFESIFIDIYFDHKVVTCGTIYRSPKKDTKSLNKFFEYLNFVFNKLKHNKNVYIMGDTNINLIDQKDPGTEILTDTMFNNNFFPLINRPTRLTNNYASTIDHIWTNITCVNITSGILVHSVSDHFPIFQISEIGKLRQSCPIKNLFFSASNLINFQASLENIDYSNVATSSDPDLAFQNLQNIFLNKFNQNFFKQSKNQKQNSQWFDKELWSLLHKKDRLHKKYIQKNNLLAKEKYLKIRNQYFHLIKQKKREYFKNKFKNYKHDIKKTWQTINEILGRTKANISKTNCILEAGKMIYEPKEIANTFNTHFSTISCKLISQLPASAANYQDYLGSSNPSSMFFYPTCPQEIKRIISTLKPKLSSGWDGIPSFILKHHVV